MGRPGLRRGAVNAPRRPLWVDRAVETFDRMHRAYLEGRTTKARWDAARKRRDEALKVAADLAAAAAPKPELAGAADLNRKLNAHIRGR